MTKTFVIADPHFGHAGVCRFLRSDGSKLRPWSDPDDMDEALVENWNNVVSESDRVYLLGDVVIARRCLTILKRLKGQKVLIKGNHDIFKLVDYTPYFDDIRAYVVGKCHSGGMYMMSHVPVHPNQLQNRFLINIHGHLHSNIVMKEEHCVGEFFGDYFVATESIPDQRYINVSVEQINFTPLDLNEIISIR